VKLKEIKKLLKKYNIYPTRRLGQNFLIDEGALRKIIEAAELSKDDVVLEVGPGIGNLTMELAKRVKKVIAIEKDQKMCKILKELLEGWNVRNVEIVNKDILKLDPKTYHLKPKTYKVVANIPYYLTSPLIRKFLENTGVRPLQMILMVQKEVAQRICAKPPAMSILAVSVQFYARPEIVSYVSKKSFWPQPKIDSAIIKIASRRFCVPVSRRFRERFFRIVKAGFSQPRKQLINNLAKGLALSLPNGLKVDKEVIRNWLLENNIQPTQRAETLKIEDWINLSKTIK